MRRSGSKSTSDTTGLNHVLPPNVTSSPLPQAPTQLHNTSTARDPRETALSAVLSWSLFKKKTFGWNSERSPSREQSCAYLQGLRGLGVITKTFRHQVEERQKEKKRKTFYMILSLVFMNTGGTTEKSTSLNSFPQHHVTQDITNLLAIEDKTFSFYIN